MRKLSIPYKAANDHFGIKVVRWTLITSKQIDILSTNPFSIYAFENHIFLK